MIFEIVYKNIGEFRRKLMVLESLGSTAYSVGYTGNLQSRAKTKHPSYVVIKDTNGKLVVLTYEQYIKFVKEIERKRRGHDNIPDPRDKEKPYELGREKNGNRIIDVNNVTESQRKGSSGEGLRVSPEQKEEYERNIQYDNDQIDDFRQGKRGDCYLLSSINAIKQTKDGQDILAKNIQKNNDGSYTITLPGAIAARNHYIQQGNEDKCVITGKYTITQAAVEKAQTQAGKAYSYGDIGVILLELAMEAFRAEVYQTNKALGQESENYIAGQYGPRFGSDTLNGGQMYDAIYILTGQKSDVYEATREKKKNIKLYKYGEYGFVGEERHKFAKLGRGIGKGIVEVENIYNKDSDLQRMLDKYKGKEGEYALTVGVVVAKDGPDGSTKAGGGHALTVTKITDTYVEVVNPWDTTKKERIPRGDFEAMAMNFTVTPMSKDKVDKYYDENVHGNNNSFNPLAFLQNILPLPFLRPQFA